MNEARYSALTRSFPERAKELRREVKPALPEMSETDISRHYTEERQ